MKGKDKCEFLKSIRKQIAEKYGLDYQTTDCPHKGDCKGTCPRCDAELKDLQRQLHKKGIDDIDLNVSMDKIPDNQESQVEVREIEPLQGSIVDPAGIVAIRQLGEIELPLRPLGEIELPQGSIVDPALTHFPTQSDSDQKDDDSVEENIEMGDIPEPSYEPDEGVLQGDLIPQDLEEHPQE